MFAAHGHGDPASQLVPPALARPRSRRLTAKNAYDPAAARALLDKFGYKDRDGDGYRETPDGKPLTIAKASTPDATPTARATSCGRSNMDAIGIRITFFTQKWPELNKIAIRN